MGAIKCQKSHLKTRASLHVEKHVYKGANQLGCFGFTDQVKEWPCGLDQVTELWEENCKDTSVKMSPSIGNALCQPQYKWRYQRKVILQNWATFFISIAIHTHMQRSWYTFISVPACHTHLAYPHMVQVLWCQGIFIIKSLQYLTRHNPLITFSN